MSTANDPSPRRRGHHAWLAVPALLAAVALVVVLRDIGSGSPSTGAAPAVSAPAPAAEPPARTDGLRARLAARVVQILERASPVEHHDHGHDFREKGEVVCAVEAFGFDPPNATAMAEVETVYAHHLCAIVMPGSPWNQSIRAAGPLTARLTDPPVLRIAESGAGYPERVRRLIPRRYHDRAFGNFTDQAALAEARRRFEAVTSQGR